MKNKKLTSAIVTGLALIVGQAAPVHSMNLNPLGTGQVLVFPYYTVNAGNQTLVSVVNKTDAGKAIKVRFREGRNARSVMEFNLYLSPFDVWTAAVFSLSDTGPGNPANLVTTDNSCTAPAIKGNASLPRLSNGSRYAPYSNDVYTAAFDDAGPETLDRTREGYLEMIEMGEVTNQTRNTLTAITHQANGVPVSCSQVERAWFPVPQLPPTDDAYWSANALIDLAPPQGGLYGSASIIDALAGTMMSYDADAIDGFSAIVQHTAPGSGAPGSESPSLATPRSLTDTVTAQVFSKGALVTSSYPLDRAVDAVSALFMQDEIFNEFITSPSVGGASEWVATFPTKYAYTDEAIVGAAAVPPFTRVFPRVPSVNSDGVINNATAAVDMKETLFNREEGPNVTFFDPCCCFMCPPNFPPPRRPKWYWASNVYAVNQPEASSNGSSILGSRLAQELPTSFIGVSDGWAFIQLYFDNNEGQSGSRIDQQRLRPDQSGGRWLGLPVTGFWAVSFTNGQLTPGVLSNYAAAYKHRGSNSYQPQTTR